MTLAKLFGTALVALSLSAPVLAQQAGAAPQGSAAQTDQVGQLAQMVGLSDDQQKEIRDILEEMQGEIGTLREEARALQEQMQAEIKADYDEGAIREHGEDLGEVTGEIAVLSALMQAKVDSVFTQEQRDELDKKMQEMRQQMQQRQMMMQQQGQ
ncbi:Spy/CpxP family protein refolding chaperone [Marinobacter salexigens]|uniref:Spy/CpxP family protein refolding chaperone n=1 Tax=Marinobacter salexigens TaxID=1925763 RepID=UPI0012903C1B|nr:Spy/CpxP family protein refolding chaperone [Marinobacter salexigens]